MYKEQIRTWYLSPEYNFIGTRIFNELKKIGSVVNCLSGPHSTFLIWIDVKVVNESEEQIIELRTSQRFRKPSLLHNQETGHSPFKIM